MICWSCNKDENLLPLPTTPHVQIESVSKDTIIEFKEQLVINIKYEDGDGDLGNKDTDINSLFIKDSRLELPDEYYIPPLAPEGTQISITGILNIPLSGTFVLGNGESEVAYFDVWMVDRVGNKSNVVRTNQIVIKKE